MSPQSDLVWVRLAHCVDWRAVVGPDDTLRVVCRWEMVTKIVGTVSRQTIEEFPSLCPRLIYIVQFASEQPLPLSLWLIDAEQDEESHIQETLREFQQDLLKISDRLSMVASGTALVHRRCPKPNTVRVGHRWASLYTYLETTPEETFPY
jgi:hypothetical protein